MTPPKNRQSFLGLVNYLTGYSVVYALPPKHYYIQKETTATWR